MATAELTNRSEASTGILYSVTPETIAQRRSELMALTVAGVNDEVGLAHVKAGLREVIKWRTSVEATRKELKAEYLEAGRRVDEDAKTIQAVIAPIEKHLAEQKKRVDDELARIEQEKADAVYNARRKRMEEAGGKDLGQEYLMSMSEAVFEMAVQNASEANRLRRIEEQRLAAEEAERKRQAELQAEANRLEKERLAAERAEFAKQQAEQEAERRRVQAIEDEKRAAERAELDRQREEQAKAAAAIKAESDRLAKIEADRLTAIEQERLQAEAAERARVETEERLKREAQVAEQNRIAQEAADKRALELRPAKAKLNEFANIVMNLDVPSGLGDFTENQVQMALNTAAETIRKIGANLS